MTVSQVISNAVQATPGDKVLYASLLLGTALLTLLIFEQIKGSGKYGPYIKRGVRTFGGLLILDYLFLVYYFVVSDFTYNYVWTFSDRNLPLYYNISSSLSSHHG